MNTKSKIESVYKSSLYIEDYALGCHLGCTAEERKEPQEIRISLKISFFSQPKVCLSDKLEDTICYAKICTLMKSVVDEKHYSTVEHLGYQILTKLKIRFSSHYKFTLELHKVSPPVEGLLGGVVYSCSDDDAFDEVKA